MLDTVSPCFRLRVRFLATKLRSLDGVGIFALLGVLYGSFQESASAGILAQLSVFHGAADCFFPELARHELSNRVEDLLPTCSFPAIPFGSS